MTITAATRGCASLLLVILLFSSCFKDKCLQTYTYYEPIYRTSEQARANVRSNVPRQVENPGKLFTKGNYIFLNEIDRGIHVIDNSNPSSPRNIAFIDIPGNMDLAVKGELLYADMFMDLVAIDISNPMAVQVRTFIDDAFPFRRYTAGFIQDSSRMIVDWMRKDTTVEMDCGDGGFFGIGRRKDVVYAMDMLQSASSNSGANSTPFGKGGSMARFTIVNNRLYTVTDQQLNVFDINTPANPVFTRKVSIGFGIETIFPFSNRLFIGANNGMFIYDISNADQPEQIGKFSHTTSCDPVIADPDFAYVTLRSGTTCQGFTNQLEILSLQSITDPRLISTYEMTNPHGLSKDGNLLFVCDGPDGLKIYDASDVRKLFLLDHIKGLETYDVITWNKIALVVAKGGLYQYDYSDIYNIKLLSKINVNN